MIALLVSFCIVIAGVSLALTWPLLKRDQHKAATALALLLVVAAGGLYALLGSPAIIDVTKERKARIEALAPRIAELSKQLQENPNHAEGWAELGQALFIAEQFSAAANAFKQAVVLHGGDAELMLLYAQSLIFADGGQVNEQAKKALEMVLMIDPKNKEALALRNSLEQTNRP